MEAYGHPELIPFLERVADGAAVDWDALFNGYHSAVDWPPCAFYRELAERYPQAKVILTERDPADWYRSAMDTILSVGAGASQDSNPVASALVRMAVRPVIEKKLGGRTDDRERAMTLFKRHNEEVRRAVPAERLLVYRCEEGWRPLSRFLGVPTPEEPFPWVNTTGEFRASIMGRDEKY